MDLDWTWIACDAPTLLYALQAFGLGEDRRVRNAVEHLIDLAQPGGYRCSASPEVGRFRGPGRRCDPYPIANVYALKALAQRAEITDSSATHGAAGPHRTK